MHVTAVVVSHNGSTFLPEVLRALNSQTRPVDAVVGYDAGSDDNSFEILRTHLPNAQLVRGRANGSFGASVKAALSDSGALKNSQAEAESRFFWFLHDDSAPDSHALAELLSAVERAPSVTIAGCKQVDWDQPKHLIDVGLTSSHQAERLTMIEVDEQDQGQYDGRSDTFAVNSAGMLVRQDAWANLSGFDPALPSVGDDVDLSWRNRLAGNRVVVVPSATMRHVISRAEGLSSNSAARKAQVHTQLKHCAPAVLPFVWISSFFTGLWRLCAGLLFKEPGYGARQFGATMVALFRFGAISRGRSNANRTRRTKRSVIRRLQVGASEVRTYRRAVGEALLGVDDSRREAVDAGTNEFEPTGDANDDFASIATARRLWVGAGMVVAVVLTGLLGLISLARFIGGGALWGGNFIPVSSSLGTIWDNALTWWSTVGPGGAPVHGHPFGIVLWLLGLCGFGDASAALLWLVILSMPLAALGAWAASSSAFSSRWARLVVATLWGTTPVLSYAIVDGRIGAVFAAILTPWILLAGLRALGLARGRRNLDGSKPTLIKPGQYGRVSYAAAAAGGLTLAVLTAAAPVLLPLAVVLIVLTVVLAPRRSRALWWMLVPSVALYLPYVVSNLGNPRAIIADVGMPARFEAAPAWLQAMGVASSGNGYGSAPWLSFINLGIPLGHALALAVAVPVLVVAAVAALWPHQHAAKVRVLWIVAILAFATAIGAGYIATAQSADAAITPYSGPALAVAAFSLVLAGGFGLDALLTPRAETPMSATAQTKVSGVRRSVASAASVVLLLSCVASGYVWIASNFSAADAFAVKVQSTQMLPATAIDQGRSPAQSRTVVITASTSRTFSGQLMRGAGTRLDSLNPAVSAEGISGFNDVSSTHGAADTLRQAVATVTAGTGADPRSTLRSLGANFVVLRHVDSATQLLASQIDAVPGLVKIGETDTGWLWRVDDSLPNLSGQGISMPGGVAAVQVTDQHGNALGYLPSTSTGVNTKVVAGQGERTVVLSERADVHWRASFNGKPLDAVPGTGDSSWAQAYRLPAEAGDLVISYEQPWAVPMAIIQSVLLVFSLLMAVPMPASRGRSRAALWSASWQKSTNVGRSAKDKPRRSSTKAASDAEGRSL